MNRMSRAAAAAGHAVAWLLPDGGGHGLVCVTAMSSKSMS
jgi:hypothetical protein